MTKFLLALIGLSSTLTLSAQNCYSADILYNQTNNKSINIAISNYDLEDGNTFYENAEEAEHKGDFNTALTLFGKAAFEYNVVRNLNRYAQCVTKMSQMHYQLGRFIDAEQILLNVALKSYSKLSNRVGVMDTYSRLGKVYLAMNKTTQSLWFYSQQGILAQRLNNNNSYIESILGIVSVKIKKRDFTLAKRDLNRVEFLARSIKSTQYAGQVSDARSLIDARTTALKK
ncbi:hypothetical protein EZJ43_04850 [Pedobacter changchengzhani]|uniref:Tetratricopeptide repeat protein n=1 Tax=Pedobacter changchengzhani TaxID=2529274 RepID=A0A4R5MP30_9SPHI|nr:hypothetical protein [Pedobacter changchengzhani]TDG37448.1 hypothetical protein EZJ43_04850 [Pedobacter changchengzhani]